MSDDDHNKGSEASDAILAALAMVKEKIRAIRDANQAPGVDFTDILARLEEAIQLRKEGVSLERDLVCLSRNDIRNIVLGLLLAGKAAEVGGESDPIKPTQTQ